MRDDRRKESAMISISTICLRLCSGFLTLHIQLLRRNVRKTFGMAFREVPWRWYNIYKKKFENRCERNIFRTMYVSNGDLEMSKQQSELGSFQKNFVVSQCYQTLDLEFPSKWSTRLGSGRSGARDSFPNQKRKRAAPTRPIYNYEQKSRRHSHSQVKYNHSDAFQSEWREPDPTRRSLFSRNFNRYVFLIRLFSPWPTAKKKRTENWHAFHVLLGIRAVCKRRWCISKKTDGRATTYI